MKSPESARLRRGVRRLAQLLTVVAALWLASPATAMAQGNKKDDEGPTKSYVLSYVIVMMAVGGGLTAVLRASKRLDKPPPKHVDDDEYED